MSQRDQVERMRRALHEQRVTLRSQTKQIERLRAELKNARAALAPFAGLKPSFDEWRLAGRRGHEDSALLQSRAGDGDIAFSRSWPIAGSKGGEQIAFLRVGDFREAHRVYKGDLTA
jgi:hypothetical protein